MMARRRWTWAGTLLVAGVLGPACASTQTPEAAKAAADSNADAERIRARLAQARAVYGRSAPRPFPLAQGTLDHARKRVADGTDPQVALEYAGQTIADEGERGIYRWHEDVDQLETVKFPRTVLEPRVLNIAIAVVRRAEGGHPRYVVLLVVQSPTENARNY